MKTKEELNALKAEIKNLNEKLSALSEDELKRVAGGHGESGAIDIIRNEMYLWLITHQKATPEEINTEIKELMSKYADSLTPAETEELRELLKLMIKAFAGLETSQRENFILPF